MLASNAVRARAVIRSLSMPWCAGTMIVPFVLASVALADVVASDYTSTNNYDVRRIGIPDFDQSREGLAGNGNCHCVPTSSIDLLTYAANHGFPDIIPGPENWYNPATYDDATLIIGLMGLVMSTGSGVDPDGCGTSLSNGQSGILQWLNDSDVDGLDVSIFYAAGGWSPSDAFLAQIAALPGHPLLTFCFGRYDQIGTLNGLPLLERTPGHCMAFAGAFRDAGNRWLDCRDPAGGGNIETQTPFANSRWLPTTQSVYVQDPDDPSNAFARSVTILRWPPPNSGWEILDKLTVVMPSAGYSFTNNGVDLFSLDVFSGTPGNGAGHYVPFAQQLVGDLAVQADNATLFALSSPSGTLAPRTLSAINPASGTSTPLAMIQGANAIATGRQRDLYALATVGTTSFLRRFDPDVTPAPETLVTLPYRSQAIAYDDGKDEVVVVSATDRRMLRIPRLINSEVDPWVDLAIPTVVPMSGFPRIAICPNQAYVWMTSPATDALYGLFGGSGGTLSFEMFAHPSIIDPTSVEFDDDGTMLVVCDAGVLGFRRNSTGAWTPVDTSAYAKHPVGSVLRVSRMRSNAIVGVHDDPSWLDAPVDSITPPDSTQPDCFGDLDGDLAVGPSDLAVLLGAWGCSSSCAADLDGDGLVAASDLALLLGAWGPCAP